MQNTFRYLFFLVTIAASLQSSLLHAQDNTLSAAEKKAGWKLLFDGKSTSQWRPFKNAESDGWEIVNGEIYCKDKNVQHRADLITKEKFADFEFAFDWRVGKGANSGLIYRADENHEASYLSATEYQLIDDIGYPGKLETWQNSGADYDMHPPTKIASKPAGEYNHSVIKAKGKHIEHWLNGVKVADYEIGTPEWFALREKSKFKDEKNWGENNTGYICLQDHGGGIWFKNIKIKMV